MRTVAEVEADIATVKAELNDVHGSTTEVYARIVGYYRSVRNWNPGKREEYDMRKIFIADENRITEHLPLTTSSVSKESESEKATDSCENIHYELFVRKTCPNCPPVKEYCANLLMEGNLIDVDSADGFNRASSYGVFSAPTAIFFDANGNETGRAHTVKEIRAVLSPAYINDALLSAVV